MNTSGKLPTVVCIGGGTGTFVVLKGLKKYPLKLSAIVSMSDSGGSNKRIIDEFGLLPTSDIRQCLVALSDEQKEKGLLRKLFMYRFDKGEGISGMTFGNLFMAALTDIVGSQQEAIKQTGKVLRIHGSVIPVTLSNTNLVATYDDGTVLEEEHFIDMPKHDGNLKIREITLKPEAVANDEAIKAILQADVVIGSRFIKLNDGTNDYLTRIPSRDSNEYDYYITSTTIVISRYYNTGTDNFYVIIFTRSLNP